MTSQQQERERGRAYARAWRERMKPDFDAMYGRDACSCCGRPYKQGAA